MDREILLKEIGEFHAFSCSADGDPQDVTRPRTPPRQPTRSPRVARDRSSRQLLAPQARPPREPTSHCDFVKPRFVARERHRLWVSDINEHRTTHDRVFCGAMFDVVSRRIVGGRR